MKTHLKSYIKQPKTVPIYKPQKYNRWGPTLQETLLSIDRQRSDFQPLGNAVDRTVDQKLGLDLTIDRPVDRGHLHIWASLRGVNKKS